ncbi:unnamed protein product [Ectocarpus sp. 8 AP-2014]|uniref:Uncharacterized protein n=1 Tax=Ectocarpus siliculosus TaxID=2880 RepID=D8LDV0_ECTSI|nr:hypothetical protein Esi_0126_0066 [Ectocarpus siliculosus]|eukprot:CBN78507.1 hypothetical protein Esi_0126_0066 [Ectocarpus siliculosus]
MTLEDTEYWLGHPELQGMVAHFMAKGGRQEWGSIRRAAAAAMGSQITS